MYLSHIVGTRSAPVPEIKEVFVPEEAAAAKVLSMSRTWDVVFILRTFRARAGDRVTDGEG